MVLLKDSLGKANLMRAKGQIQMKNEGKCGEFYKEVNLKAI